MMRPLALAALAALAGCAIEMTEIRPWVPVEEITGALAAELSPPPASMTGRGLRPAVIPDPLRVVTYNVQLGFDVEALAATLLDHPALGSAAVYLIQEEEAYPEEAASRTSRLAALLGFAHAYVPARERDGGTHGLAILSAFPIVEVAKMELPDAGKGRLRIAVQAVIEVLGRRLHVIDLHLDTKLNTQERIAQLHPIVIDAPATTLVAGDFNTCWVEWVGGTIPVLSSSLASDQAPIVDSYMRELGFDATSAGSGPTEHMLGLEQRLDSIYTRGLAVTFGGVERVGPSDHWPMWIDVEVPD
jgi:endonuclease/exonuclease/phosphatase family metal-dependent hydrolase